MSSGGDNIEDEVQDTEELTSSNPFVETIRSYMGGGQGPLTAARIRLMSVVLKGAFTVGLILGLGYWALIYFGGL